MTSMMEDMDKLILRLIVGGLMAGHGAQKVFGAFEGPGITGTAGMMEHLGLKPGRFWGAAAGAAEFGGGTLTALGLFDPVGPLSVAAAMIMATATVHWGKPVWAAKGGAELPMINMSVALALALTGPGQYSLDQALGIHLPSWFGGVTAATAAATVAFALKNRQVASAAA